MTLSSRDWAPALLAVVLLGLIVVTTSESLKSAVAWPGRRVGASHATPPDPYARLDGLIASGAREDVPSTLRDPFGYGNVPAAATMNPHPAVHHAPVPPLAPQPVLTAVVSDADPQAVIRFDGRNYTVRVGNLFADYQVISISAEQVVLDHNGERIVLRRTTKGE